MLVPAGVYRMGCLELKSHVTLHLEAGAILRASEERWTTDGQCRR